MASNLNNLLSPHSSCQIYKIFSIVTLGIPLFKLTTNFYISTKENDYLGSQRAQAHLKVRALSMMHHSVHQQFIHEV